MGQDLIRLNKIGNPFEVYNSFFKRGKDFNYNNSEVSIEFRKNENLIELCERFSNNDFRKALPIDNLYRILNLNFMEYVFFLFHTIVKTNNFHYSAEFIFNSTDYEFVDFYNNLYGFDQIDVVEEDNNFSINELGEIFYTPEHGGIFFPWVDYDILWRMPISNFQFNKSHTKRLILYLLMIEDRILGHIKDDCEIYEVSIGQSVKNQKWILLYSLASARNTLESELDILEYGIAKCFFVSNKIEEITELFNCYFQEVTDLNPLDYGSNIVEFLCGKKRNKEFFEDYFAKIFDKNLGKFTLKDRRIGISKIFYFLYKKKWFITHYSKSKNSKRKGTEFSETLHKLLIGIKGFSETNIRENHLLDLGHGDEIELTSNSDNSFSKTNYLIKKYR